MISKPILRQPDFKKPFILFTDASNYAIGALLAQLDSSGREHVVAYSSRKLKGAEIHYGITEKECLSVVVDIKKFRVYLYGTRFKVIADHSALSWLINIKDPNGRLARWAIYLQMYDFEMIHRRGRMHCNVDAISRPVVAAYLVVVKDDSVQIEGDIYKDNHLISFVKTGLHCDGASLNQVKRVERQAKHYKYDANTIYYSKSTSSDKWVEVPPIESRVSQVEKSHLLGHFQSNSTYNRLREN